MCWREILPYTGYVHHFKTDYRVIATALAQVDKPKRPSVLAYSHYTNQLWMCSMECVVLKGLDGVYREGA